MHWKSGCVQLLLSFLKAWETWYSQPQTPYIWECFDVEMPHNLEILTNLQTLNLVKGELWLMGLHKVKDFSTSNYSRPECKEHLWVWTGKAFTLEFTSATWPDAEAITEKLQPSCFLNRIVIEHYRGVRFLSSIANFSNMNPVVYSKMCMPSSTWWIACSWTLCSRKHAGCEENWKRVLWRRLHIFEVKRLTYRIFLVWRNG